MHMNKSQPLSCSVGEPLLQLGVIIAFFKSQSLSCRGGVPLQQLRVVILINLKFKALL